ncbi:MAG: hypothetical protein RUDDFDWM_001360 [Candidatus Fervidibacterota bacterium]
MVRLQPSLIVREVRSYERCFQSGCSRPSVALNSLGGRLQYGWQKLGIIMETVPPQFCIGFKGAKIGQVDCNCHLQL